jgi:hypothetical protein
MLTLLVYVGIVFFFFRLMRLLHERDRDALAKDEAAPAQPRGKGFVSFLDQARSRS